MLVRSDGVVRTRKVAPRGPPRPIGKGGHLYEIEEVVNARNGKFGREYLVKWRGYGSKENMWISELPSFFKKRSRFYLSRKGLRDEDCSDSGLDDADASSEEEEEEGVVHSDSDEEEAVESDSDASSSSGSVASAGSGGGGGNGEDDDGDYYVRQNTTTTTKLTKHHARKRKYQEEKKCATAAAAATTDVKDLARVAKFCRCAHHTSKKFLQEDEDQDDQDDDDDDDSEPEDGGVNTSPSAGPPSAVRLQSLKKKGSKKEQLAMRALLALADYVNDTGSDSE
ncbi:hypothetical protein T484DRAFT_1864056 [Baffinella frigidus]|nr:hypothetical protein T484DRAFT_1864056 [Cryptophyta sp. CCMP2293]